MPRNTIEGERMIATIAVNEQMEPPLRILPQELRVPQNKQNKTKQKQVNNVYLQQEAT